MRVYWLRYINYRYQNIGNSFRWVARTANCMRRVSSHMRSCLNRVISNLKRFGYRS